MGIKKVTSSVLLKAGYWVIISLAVSNLVSLIRSLWQAFNNILYRSREVLAGEHSCIIFLASSPVWAGVPADFAPFSFLLALLRLFFKHSFIWVTKTSWRNNTRHQKKPDLNYAYHTIRIGTYRLFGNQDIPKKWYFLPRHRSHVLEMTIECESLFVHSVNQDADRLTLLRSGPGVRLERIRQVGRPLLRKDSV